MIRCHLDSSGDRMDFDKQSTADPTCGCFEPAGRRIDNMPHVRLHHGSRIRLAAQAAKTSRSPVRLWLPSVGEPVGASGLR